MSKGRLLTAILIPALSAACGPAQGSGSLNGTVVGYTLFVKDATFEVVRDPSGRVLVGNLSLSDRPGLCTNLRANRVRVGENRLTFTVLRIDPGEYRVLGGGFSLSPDRNARARFSRTCEKTTEALGESGRLTITAQLGGAVTGTFDVTFVGTQTTRTDRVTGSFSAPACEDSLVDNGITVTCD